MTAKQPVNRKLDTAGLKIIRILQQNGFKAFLVGGTVRNALLRLPLGDIDIATSAKPDEIESVLSSAGIRFKSVGKKYGTILALAKEGAAEITTFRRDNEYNDRRHPKSVSFVDDQITDSERRDLTINAIYYDPIAKNVFDPQKGINDLEKKLIRFVGDPKERINEDALRMLRAVRLATQLKFKMESNTFAAIKTRVKYIQSISGERVKSEVDKILSLDNRAEGIRLLDRIGLLQFIMPELWECKNHTHKSRRYHLEGSVYEHSLLALSNSPKNLVVSYAALYHDVGKPNTATPKLKEEGWVNSYPKHELASADLFLDLASRLKFSRADRSQIHWMIKMHMKRHSFVKDMTEEKQALIATNKHFPALLELWRADSVSNLRYEGDKIKPGTPVAFKHGMKLLRALEKNRRLIGHATNGNFIMQHGKISAGPKISSTQNKITAQIIFSKVKNLRDAKTFLKNLR